MFFIEFRTFPPFLIAENLCHKWVLSSVHQLMSSGRPLWQLYPRLGVTSVILELRQKQRQRHLPPACLALAAVSRLFGARAELWVRVGAGKGPLGDSSLRVGCRRW